jgi:hypothetical protein
MKSNNTVFWSFALLVAIASLYRVLPHGTYGFPPQLAMAVFAGAIIKNKKFSFLMPLGSMFLSDLLFQGLYALGYSNTPGFYEGQWVNYLLIGSLTVFGFWAKNLKPGNILAASLAAPTFYFLASNLAVWAVPKTLRACTVLCRRFAFLLHILGRHHRVQCRTVRHLPPVYRTNGQGQASAYSLINHHLIFITAHHGRFFCAR